MTFREMMEEKRKKRKEEELSAIKDGIGILLLMLYIAFGLWKKGRTKIVRTNSLLKAMLLTNKTRQIKLRIPYIVMTNKNISYFDFVDMYKKDTRKAMKYVIKILAKNK